MNTKHILLAVSVQSAMGSTRALACSDRRPAGRNPYAVRSPNGDAFGCTNVVGEGADHSTRGRARSPLQVSYGVSCAVVLLTVSLMAQAELQARHDFPPDELLIKWAGGPE